jgi:hypothetical protein
MRETDQIAEGKGSCMANGSHPIDRLIHCIKEIMHQLWHLLFAAAQGNRVHEDDCITNQSASPFIHSLLTDHMTLAMNEKKKTKRPNKQYKRTPT